MCGGLWRISDQRDWPIRESYNCLFKLFVYCRWSCGIYIRSSLRLLTFIKRESCIGKSQFKGEDVTLLLYNKRSRFSLKGHQNLEHLSHQNQPDKAGRLWAGQETGLSVFNGWNREFSTSHNIIWFEICLLFFSTGCICPSSRVRLVMF